MDTAFQSGGAVSLCPTRAVLLRCCPLLCDLVDNRCTTSSLVPTLSLTPALVLQCSLLSSGVTSLGCCGRRQRPAGALVTLKVIARVGERPLGVFLKNISGRLLDYLRRISQWRPGCRKGNLGSEEFEWLDRVRPVLIVLWGF